MLDIVSSMSREDTEFFVETNDEGMTTIRFAIFDGSLSLNSDGTWEFENS
jgi:hypothetical protein